MVTLIAARLSPCTTVNLAPVRRPRPRPALRSWDNKTGSDVPLASGSSAPRRRPVQTQTDSPLTLARNLARALVDVKLGRRDLGGLRRWLHYSLCQSLEADLQPRPAQVPPRRASWVKSSRMLQVSDEAAEISVTVETDNRVHAVALRVQLVRGRWIITALEMA